MTAKVRFRAATEADVDTVVALVESAYRGDASRAGWTTEADLLGGQRTDAAAVGELIDRPKSMVLLGSLAHEQADEQVVVCAHLEQRAPVAYFGLFAVAPGGQGAGVGAATLAEAERIAGGEWRAAAMEMTVLRQRGDLLAWYERRGYRATGETRPFPYGDERYGLPTRPDLAFVVLVKRLVRP